MPSKGTVQKALRSIKRRANYDYFFLKLENPDWIIPLRESGLFSSPPAVEKDGTYIRYHHWPESKYLMRMADQAPEIVTETIVNVPDTGNERVHEDFVEAATKMPPEHAAKIAKSELKWIKDQEHFYFLYPDNVGMLISHLAKCGKIRIAFELTKALLDIDKVEREIGTPGDEWYHKSAEIVAKFQTWEYGRVLEKNIPDLVEAGGMPVFEILCGLLEKAMSLKLGHENAPYDYSYIWRKAIDEHEQDRGGASDIKSFLVVAVRDAALQMVKANESILPELVANLENRAWLIFKRISLYLLSQFAGAQPEMVAERLTNHALFEDEGFRHEYAQLARAGFGSLTAEQKGIILSWIEKGPDIAEFEAHVLENLGREASDDEVQRRIKVWQRDRLDQLKESLPENWRHRFDTLVQKFDEAEHPEFASYSRSWVGPTSPKTLDELKQMTVDEIALFLKEWTPPEKEMDHSPEGLSRVLADAVAANPIQFAAEAEKFIELDPTYVRGVVNGLTNVAKSHSGFSWEPVLGLCLWVVEQPRKIPDRKSEYADLDPGWVWTRKSIASLLSSGLKSGSGEIPFEFRSLVRDVLLPLTDDPEPEHEEYGEGQMDPSTLSINTVRGEAMHSLVDYALWVIRNSEEEEKSFDVMPEVQDVLEKHLDLKVDPSLAIRSVYGRWFPWLNLIDKNWAEQAKGKIFSVGSPKYWDSAWKTYVTFCKPYDDLLEVLREQYSLAIKQIGKQSEIEIDMANAEKRLSEHLMAFYGRGKLQLDDNLIVAFYENASLKLRAHAIEFLGRSLGSSDAPLPEGYEARLHELWEWRFAQTTESREVDELADFCWWFASGKLDESWALSQLKAVLELPIKPDSLDFAAEQLVKVTGREPMSVLECLSLMINKLGEEGVYFGWNDEAKQILGTAVKQEDVAVKVQATEIIHRLGAMGYFEFRELL